MRFPTWRKPMALATALLIGTVAALALLLDGRVASYTLAAGLAAFAAARALCAERDVLTARSRTFDVVALLSLALAIALLAPWALATLPD